MQPEIRPALVAVALAALAFPGAPAAAPAGEEAPPAEDRPEERAAPGPEEGAPRDEASTRGEDRDGAAGEEASAAARPSAPSLDFDLLGEAKPPPETADAGKMRLRRKLLTVHQGIGLGLLGLQLGTTVVGQLNYSDRFGGGPDTGRYRLAHKTLAYSTLGVFAVNGVLALLAPSPNTPRKLDRVQIHRYAMLAAAAGMLTQGILGIYTRERIGRLDQDELATAHLVVGYATLAALLTGVGALVF
jgi:hypothetical protein